MSQAVGASSPTTAHTRSPLSISTQIITRSPAIQSYSFVANIYDSLKSVQIRDFEFARLVRLNGRIHGMMISGQHGIADPKGESLRGE